MGQMGFFDVAARYAGLDAKKDPLLKIDEAVSWERFRGASGVGVAQALE